MKPFIPQIGGMYLSYNLRKSVGLCVTFFSPTSHGPISNLNTFLESLGLSGLRKNTNKQIREETKKFHHSIFVPKYTL